jgi:hypothetical protein
VYGVTVMGECVRAEFYNVAVKGKCVRAELYSVTVKGNVSEQNCTVLL